MALMAGESTFVAVGPYLATVVEGDRIARSEGKQ